MPSGTGTQFQKDASPQQQLADISLRLLPALEPWPKTFLRNLRDALLLRDIPNAWDRRVYEGWQTAYIFTDPPWTRIRESWFAHCLLVAVTFAACTSNVLQSRAVRVTPLRHAQIQYFPVSEYLPAIGHVDGASHRVQPPSPVLAKQEIISVRAQADNRTQTLITAPNLQLQKDVLTPNMVVWAADPVPPVVATPSSRDKMNLPLDVQVVQPRPDIDALHREPNLGLQASIVRPVADDARVRATRNLALPSLSQEIAAPAPKLPVQIQRATEINVSVVPPAPHLDADSNRAPRATTLQPSVVPALAAVPELKRPEKEARGLQPTAVPPQPTIGDGAAQNQSKQRIIALNARPVEVKDPAPIFAGNRNGEFASGPNGRDEASGQPDSSKLHVPSELGAGKSGEEKNGPAGIYVASPPHTDKPANAEMASLQFPKMHSTVTELAKATKRSDTEASARSALADKIFGDKRYYSLTLNMPNLNSPSGSWVVRFTELNEKRDGVPLHAPVAIDKLDPVYPQQLIRERVEGTVTLYAVIRQDGSVAKIRVLKSIDQQLDYCAMRALAGWRFQPGMKDGNAVSLEAIIDIPFRLKSLSF